MKKIAVITGGNRGIGKSISKKMSFFTYVTISITSNGLNVIKFSSYLRKIKIKNILVLKLNLFRFEDIGVIISYIRKKIGHIVILINNAGILSDCLFLKMDESKWFNVINLNLNSIFF